MRVFLGVIALRNTFLKVLLISIVGLAACVPAPSEDSFPANDPLPTLEPTRTIAATATITVQPMPSSALPDLDMREANVLAVEFEQLEDGRYRFDVTLIHDDDGEAPEYADGWQVESEDGALLGQRSLTHAHGNQPFTRSLTIEIPAGIAIVIVRGHDMQHAFGGQSMRVNLQTGECVPIFLGDE